MTRIELTVARQYARQLTYLSICKRFDEAMALFDKARSDSDLTEDAFKVLSAICDGISDYNNSL